MGLFMAPGLPLLNLVKLVAIFYIKSWAVLVTNVPHEIVFKVLTIFLSIYCKTNIRNLFITHIYKISNIEIHSALITL